MEVERQQQTRLRRRRRRPVVSSTTQRSLVALNKLANNIADMPERRPLSSELRARLPSLSVVHLFPADWKHTQNIQRERGNKAQPTTPREEEERKKEIKKEENYGTLMDETLVYHSDSPSR